MAATPKASATHEASETPGAIASPATAATPAMSGMPAAPDDALNPATDEHEPPAPYRSTVIKSFIGLAVLAVVGWMPMQRLFETSSVQAVVNATIVTIRAPIPGVVGGPIANLSVGKSVSVGDGIVTIENSLVDNGKLEVATSLIDSHEAGLNAVRLRIEGLETVRERINDRLEKYRIDRARRLASRIEEADAMVSVARAEWDLVAGKGVRAPAQSGKMVRPAEWQKYKDPRLVAAAAHIGAAEAAKSVLVVEQEALLSGRFLGDDYNDAPRSAQRIDDINETLVQLRADEARLGQELKNAREQLMQQAEAVDPLRHSMLFAPVRGRVWEILSAPGEQVVAGQHLLSLVDCSKLLVTAAVSESVYNSIVLGMNVKFLLDGSNIELAGSVVQLSGMASASSNYAIDPSALTREAYRVGISIDTRKIGDVCAVGRTGRVIFEDR